MQFLSLYSDFVFTACAISIFMLRVDVGDEIIGPHRILLSIIKSVTESPDGKTITIETKNTVYVLERMEASSAQK